MQSQLNINIESNIEQNLTALSKIFANLMWEFANDSGHNDMSFVKKLLDNGVIKNHIIEDMIIRFCTGQGKDEKIRAEFRIAY